MRKSPAIYGKRQGKEKVKKCCVVNSDKGMSFCEAQLPRTAVFFAFAVLNQEIALEEGQLKLKEVTSDMSSVDPEQNLDHLHIQEVLLALI